MRKRYFAKGQETESKHLKKRAYCLAMEREPSLSPSPAPRRSAVAGRLMEWTRAAGIALLAMIPPAHAMQTQDTKPAPAKTAQVAPQPTFLGKPFDLMEKLERELIEGLPKADIDTLITHLDNKYFYVRIGAQNELVRRAGADAERDGVMPQWTWFLQPVQDKDGKWGLKRGNEIVLKGLDWESRRRLPALEQSIAEMKNEVVLKPTKFTSEKKEMPLHELLARLAKASNRRVDMPYSKAAQLSQMVTVNNGTLWEAIRSASLADGQRLWVMESKDEAMHMRAYSPDAWRFASTEALLGKYDMKSGTLYLDGEPKVDVQSWSVTHMHMNDDTENDVKPKDGTLRGSPGVTLPLPVGAQGIVNITIECKVAPSFRFDIADPEKPCTFVSSGETFFYEGISKTPDAHGKFAVHIRQDGEKHTISRMRCTAQDAQGKHIAVDVPFYKPGTTVKCEAHAKPASISFYLSHQLPDTVQSTQRTLSFALDDRPKK